MLNDWTYWLSSVHRDELVTLVMGLLLIDGPRYALTRIIMCLWDLGAIIYRLIARVPDPAEYTHCPSVCVILAGHNEALTIESTLRSVYETYPRLEIVVVDDGSVDGMAEVSHQFARNHPGVLVFSRSERGGKSSAMNFALPFTKAEIIINVDADSELGPNAIWEMVQPFADPEVGTVSATILARNPFDNVITWLQAYEYLHSIFVGRMLAARAGILGIASGAYAATRRTVIERVGGWDVGPPEDLDLTLRIRKLGLKVAFAPYSLCLTDLPTTWKGLIKQRLRWDQGAVVRNHCRKHVDMANPFRPGFRVLDFVLLLDNWIFQLICPYAFWVYTCYMILFPPSRWYFLGLTLYAAMLIFELIQVASLLFYSPRFWKDAWTCLVFPLMPFYQLLFMAVRMVANTQELLFRSSFHDNYVPKKVREATWQW